jgi:hypothetical protein
MASTPHLANPANGRTARWISVLIARPLTVALSLVAAIILVRAAGSVGSDVSWQLWIGHQLNGGVVLYKDIIETNPPLWFWMGMPVDWLAGQIHARSDHVLILIIGGLAALSLAATDRLLSDVAAPRRSLLLGYATFILVLMPWLQTGQREQIVLIGTLPYAALICARRTGRPVDRRIAFVIGASAAFGFALKHYFLLVPMFLEIWLILGLRKAWRPFRSETLAIVAVGTTYAVALAVFEGNYLAVALPLILLAYGVTGAEHLVDLFQPAVLTSLAILALLAARIKTLRAKETGFAAAMAVAAVGFAGAYFLQAKGWNYHAVPLLGCTAIAFAALLCSGLRQPRIIALAAPALLCLPFWISAQQVGQDREEEMDVRKAVNGLRAGESVGFIGSDPALGWPVTLQRGFRYPSRYNGFWMMRAVVRNEIAGSPDPRLAELGRQVVRETVLDFRCAPPKRIIVARPKPRAESGEFDILAFFQRDPDFARLLTHYRPIDRTTVQTFALVSPVAAGHGCLQRA